MQVYFRMSTNNFLAYCANTALALNLLSSLGVQFNAVYTDQAVNPTLLSWVLFGAGAATIVLTLFPFCAALRRPQLLRPVPLPRDADEPSSSEQHAAPADPAMINSADAP